MIQINNQNFFGWIASHIFQIADTNIMLTENGELIMKNQDIADTLLTINLDQL